MKTYRISYSGVNSKFKGIDVEINAHNGKQAVRILYALYCGQNCFPQDNGSIKDSDGVVIAEPNDNYIKFDGGYFEAHELQEVEL